MKWLKAGLPKWIVTVVGAVVFADKFFKNAQLHNAATWFLRCSVLFAAFAMILGSANLIRVSLHKARSKREHWKYNYVLVATLVGYTILGLAAGTSSPAYKFIYNGVYVPAQATIISFMAFWLATACYRAFRVRNAHAVILLVSGITVMLGKIGVGSVIWKDLPRIADWMMNVPTSAVMRSLGMGIAIGMIGTGLRVVLGIERGYLGGDQS